MNATKLKEIQSATKFITDLKASGIPASAISTNNWNDSPNTIVYVTIPYGSKNNSGKWKSWKNRFGATATKSAILENKNVVKIKTNVRVKI